MISIPIHSFKCKCQINRNGCDSTPKQWKNGEMDVILQQITANRQSRYEFRIKGKDVTTIGGIVNVISAIEGKLSIEYADNPNIKSYLFLSSVCKEDQYKITSIFNPPTKRKSTGISINQKKMKLCSSINILPNYLMREIFLYLNHTYAFNKRTDRIACKLVKSIKINSNALTSHECIMVQKRHQNANHLSLNGVLDKNIYMPSLLTLHAFDAKYNTEDINRLFINSKQLSAIHLSRVDQSSIPLLKCLKLKNFSIKEDINIYNMLGFNYLEILSLPYITDSVSLLTALPNLQDFSFGESDRTKKTMLSLSLLKIKHLRMHTMSSNKSSKAYNNMIDGLGELQCLDTIELNWVCNGQFLQKIGETPAAMTLQCISFHSSDIKNEDVIRLLESCDKLIELDISYCAALTEFCLNANYLPELKKITHSIDQFNRDPSKLQMFEGCKIFYKALKPNKI